MKKILENIKTIIAELAGIIGGFFWARATHWDYEPLILIVISIIGFILSMYFITSSKEKDSQSNSIVSKNSEQQSQQSIQQPVLQPATIIQNPRNYSHETPESISKKIDAAPIFQKDDVAHHFEGLNVEWHLKLFIIHKRESPKITVVMRSLTDTYMNIAFETNTDDYPIFKIAYDKKEFIVRGKIKKCEKFDIKLELLDLSEI